MMSLLVLRQTVIRMLIDNNLFGLLLSVCDSKGNRLVATNDKQCVTCFRQHGCFSICA